MHNYIKLKNPLSENVQSVYLIDECILNSRYQNASARLTALRVKKTLANFLNPMDHKYDKIEV